MTTLLAQMVYLLASLHGPIENRIYLTGVFALSPVVLLVSGALLASSFLNHHSAPIQPWGVRVTIVTLAIQLALTLLG